MGLINKVTNHYLRILPNSLNIDNGYAVAFVKIYENINEREKEMDREFKIYVEQASKPKGKIKEARVEALRAGFKDCYVRKEFKTIVMLGDKIPQNLRDEDDVLLQFYDIAQNKI